MSNEEFHLRESNLASEGKNLIEQSRQQGAVFAKPAISTPATACTWCT